MKQKNIARLYEDFDKYRRQIGIPDEEQLRLVTNRKKMHFILDQNDLPRRAAGYGECFSDLRIIFVDTSIRIAAYKKYPMYKVIRVKGRKIGIPTEQPGKKKVHYRDILKTMIHELVHYRFRSLSHGVKYERRIREILAGRVFPKMNSQIVPTVAAHPQPAVMIEEEDEHNKVYSYLVNQIQKDRS